MTGKPARPSPLQNRMTPEGALEAVPARGLFTGNRGVLHDGDFNIRPARWRHKNWIICALSFKGRHREIMTPRRWTELFFLDEATALAAGHRPCAECRRQAFNAYFDAFAEGAKRSRLKAPDLDAELHAERAVPGARRQRRHEASAEDLPDGAFVLDEGGAPGMLLDDAWLPWSHFGYGRPVPRPKGGVMLLTPPGSVNALRAGFAPVLHPSAQA